MTMDLTKILIYHITDVSNLPNILAAGGNGGCAADDYWT